jgi:hypothetical protein
MALFVSMIEKLMRRTRNVVALTVEFGLDRDSAGWSWLDSVGTSMGVQQKLMRHAQIATTMNLYGNAMMESKREASRKVVRMVLGCQH